ncbi:hypothetical protein [Streptomyces sp. NPDC056061]|uniref:hypothetical protein n=1 Tax=Streptomyces sp. NPDC056061 TaxID=3345700 RepID=UPI0035DCA509
MTAPGQRCELRQDEAPAHMLISRRPASGVRSCLCCRTPRPRVSGAQLIAPPQAPLTGQRPPRHPCHPIRHGLGTRRHDPTSKRRQSLSKGKESEEEAQERLQAIIEAAQAGLRPSPATMKLAEYGETNMKLALHGLELKKLDPYLSGWRVRVVPAPGHLAVRMITNGVVDRAAQNWIADAGVQVRVLRRIAGHGSLTTTQRYLHPDVHKITTAGAALSAHLSMLRAPRSLPSPIVVAR